MPNASLLLMTSPMLLGNAPLAATEPYISPAVAPPADSVTLRQVEPMPIVWSLAASQEPASGPPDTEPGEQSSATEAENEIVVEGDYGPLEADPMGAFNETSYRITQNLDQTFVEPVAYAYRDGLPDPLRDGLGNVVRNLREPANFLNFLLQLKVGKAVETVGRFAINSTLGLGGLIDVAEKPGIGLPYRRNGFANTLGYYGVDSGAYLYLPITGATSVRDLIGDTLDQFVLPVAIGRPFNTPAYAAPYFVISNLDSRLEVDAELERIGETVDPYAARRDTYLYRRTREIALLKGEEPPAPPAILGEVEGTDDLLNDEPESTAPSDHSPQISYEETVTVPEVGLAEAGVTPVLVAITQPSTR